MVNYQQDKNVEASIDRGIDEQDIHRFTSITLCPRHLEYRKDVLREPIVAKHPTSSWCQDCLDAEAANEKGEA